MLDAKYRHSDPEIRRGAITISTPPHILEILSKDGDVRVREAVAMQTYTPVHVLAALSRDNAGFIKEMVARHINLPVEIRGYLSEDTDPVVRRAAIGTWANPPIEKLEKWVLDSSPLVRQRVAYHKIPSRLLAMLGDDPHLGVLYAVASNPQTPVETLRKLNSNGFLAGALAENPNTPADVLESLRQVRSSLLDIIAKHRNSTSEMLEKIYQYSTVLENTGFYKDAIVRALVGNPATPLWIRVACESPGF